MLNYLERLKSNPILTEISESTLGEILKKANIIRLRKRNTVFLEGSTDNNVYYILEGVAKAYTTSQEKDSIEEFYTDGHFLGNIEGLFYGKPSKKTVECITPVLLIYFKKEDILQLWQTYPKLDKLFFYVLTDAICRKRKRLEYMIGYPTVKKSCQAFYEQNHIVSHMLPNKDIASYLGTTPESIARILRSA